MDLIQVDKINKLMQISDTEDILFEIISNNRRYTLYIHPSNEERYTLLNSLKTPFYIVVNEEVKGECISVYNYEITLRSMCVVGGKNKFFGLTYYDSDVQPNG